jgi:predicted Kef-type K+ transport protein
LRLIGAWSHIVIDIVFIIALVFGPAYAGFSGRQASIAWVLAGVMFLIVAFTLIKAIRFAIHGLVEIIVVLLILIAPWFWNFASGVHSRNFYLFVGVVMLAIWFMTDFRGLRKSKNSPLPDEREPRSGG